MSLHHGRQVRVMRLFRQNPLRNDNPLPDTRYVRRVWKHQKQPMDAFKLLFSEGYRFPTRSFAKQAVWPPPRTRLGFVARCRVFHRAVEVLSKPAR